MNKNEKHSHNTHILNIKNASRITQKIIQNIRGFSKKFAAECYNPITKLFSNSVLRILRCKWSLTKTPEYDKNRSVANR